MENIQIPNGSLISFMSNKVKTQGGLNLAQGIPAFDPPSELLTILKNIATDNVHQYAPGRGNQMLLQQLSQHYKLDSENFLVVNGATEAISLLFTYIKNKEASPFSVLAFNPVYESYKHLSRIFQLPFIDFDLEADQSIDFEKLSNTIQTNSVKLIIIASPGNPLGKIWTKEEVSNMVNMAENLGFYLILDAVYSELYFETPPDYPIEKAHPNFFCVNAFSKLVSISGGRVGYLMATPDSINKISDIHDYTGLSGPSVLQQAIAFYLEKYQFGKEYVADLRDQLRGNYQQLSLELIQLGFKVYQAHGGYFIWAELPASQPDGFTFALHLYEKQKVAVVPGIHFDPAAVRFIRISIARHPYEISMAISRIKKYINER